MEEPSKDRRSSNLMEAAALALAVISLCSVVETTVHLYGTVSCTKERKKLVNIFRQLEHLATLWEDISDWIKSLKERLVTIGFSYNAGKVKSISSWEFLEKRKRLIEFISVVHTELIDKLLAKLGDEHTVWHQYIQDEKRRYLKTMKAIKASENRLEITLKEISQGQVEMIRTLKEISQELTEMSRSLNRIELKLESVSQSLKTEHKLESGEMSQSLKTEHKLESGEMSQSEHKLEAGETKKPRTKAQKREEQQKRATATTTKTTTSPTTPTNQQEEGNTLSTSTREPHWQLDDEVSHCPICTEEFSFFFRRHHCRACGRVVCDKCSSSQRDDQRTCDTCMRQ